MPETPHAEMLHEKHRQTLLDRGIDAMAKQEVRDVLLCDIHRWMAELFSEDTVRGGDR